MKTIKEVAEAAKVSKTSIYNLINKHKIPTFKKDGTTYIDDTGVSLIYAHYSIEQYETIKDIVEDEAVQPDFQSDNGRLINLLESQLNEKDKTIQALIQSNQALIQAVTNSQKLQATQMITDNQLGNFPGSPDKPKKSFFDKFFKRD